MIRSLTQACAAAALAALVTAPSAAARTITSPGTYSLVSNATHANSGPPYFVDNVPTAESQFGVVVQLDYVWWLEFATESISLPRGRYSISYRLKKLPDAFGFGSYPMTSSMSVNGETYQDVFPASSQPVGLWVDTPPLAFEVGDDQAPLSAFFGDIDTNYMKGDYWFDSFTIKSVASRIISATDIPHVHGAPYWNDDVPTTESAFGKIDEVIANSGLSWLEYFQQLTLPAGTYCATMRFKKTVDQTEAAPLHAWCSGLSGSFDTVTPVVAQPVGQWTESVPMVFTLPSETTFHVHFGNTEDFPVLKADYWFDRLVIAPVEAAHVTLALNRQPILGAPFDLRFFAPGAPGKIGFVGYALGFSPGIPLGDGRVFGLNYDVLFQIGLNPANGVFLNSIAFINPDGSLPAAPTVYLPYTPQLANLKLYACAASIDLNAPGYVVGKSSQLALDLLP